MDAAPKVAPQELVESLQQETEVFLRSVMEAVNLAADGDWIVGSEEQVRELSAEFRERVPRLLECEDFQFSRADGDQDRPN